MANWWDDAPLAEPSKTPAAAGNWWNAAPLAKSDSGFANPVQSSQGQTAPTRTPLVITCRRTVATKACTANFEAV